MYILIGKKPEEWIDIIARALKCNKGMAAGIFYTIRVNENYSKLLEYEEIVNGEKKMTRSEAINKVRNATRSYNGEEFVKAIEALGLIKFEEEKKLHLNDVAVGTRVKVIFKDGAHMTGVIESLVVL